MRILVGHTNQMPQIRQHQPLPTRQGCDDEILAFGNGYQQVEHQPGMPWHQLLANCPPGWQPDVYIHWSPEYNAIPQGLEQADCLTVGVFGDWNLGGHAIRSIAGMFDVLVADRAGCGLLRQAGYENVLYSRLWAYDPDLHRRLPACDRDIDILMIGSLNYTVHAERSRLLARVARLSARYRVVLTSGVHGEEYTRMMNRARIVFNYCVRGEINMRAYEAPACGALLFNEAANLEIRDIFTDRTHCVLYNEDNLEHLLDYYLASEHAKEREAIAQAGWEQVQTHTYGHHFGDLLNQLEPSVAECRSHPDAVKSRRTFRHKSEHQQTLNLVRHWLRTNTPGIYPKAMKELQRRATNAVGAEKAETAGLAAVVQSQWAELFPSPVRENRISDAILHAQQAVNLEPDNALFPCNLGYIYLALKRITTGERLLQRTLVFLDSHDLKPQQLRGDHCLDNYSLFHMEVERTLGRFAEGSPDWFTATRDAMRCRIAMTLAEIAFARKDYATAARQSQAAIAADPRVAGAHYGLGNAYRALGQRQSAAEAYRRAIALSPFLIEAWRDLTQICMDLNRSTEALELMNDLAAILDGCPIYAPVRGEYDRLHAEACEWVNAFQPHDLLRSKL